MTDRDHIALMVARRAARQSPCATKVGAVALPFDAPSFATVNQAPPASAEVFDRYTTSEKHHFVLYAEALLVVRSSTTGRSLVGATVVITHEPCGPCTGLLIMAGVKRIVYGPGKCRNPTKWEASYRASRLMCEEAGVERVFIADDEIAC